MVLFFSATGNTEFIARQLALKLGDGCLNLLDRVKRGDHSPIHSEKPFIICAPVYVCEMPRFLAKYLKQQTFTGSRDVYFIFTSGGYAGISGQLAKAMVRKKKMRYLGHAEFKMPRNYVANDHYPIYKENTREYTILDSENFGPMLLMEVGATMVGRIVNYHGACSVQRGQEKGRFEFGGSTVIVCLEKDRVILDEDLVRNTREGIETVVKLGEKIGTLA